MKKKLLIGIPAFLLLLVCVSGALFFFGIWHFNNPSEREYPVRGVDVSSYQGEIDWPVLAGQGLSFAYVKATEGSGHIDPNFAENWEGARKAGLAVGAYHFFSFDSTGEAQAEHYISTVPLEAGALPPAVDVEFYDDKGKNPPDRGEVQKNLNRLLDRLEARYGKKPVLYATEESCQTYLAGDYAEYDIWFRSVVKKPRLPDGRVWTFWQYSNRHRLAGYEGREPYIDMNVFRGSREEFEDYVR